MEYDKQNGDVAFRESEHLYFNLKDPTKQYVSVTTLIHKYVQPFDNLFWSSFKALEQLLSKEEWKVEKKSLLNAKRFNKEILDIYNISENEFNKVQQKILDDWAEENRKSCDRGTKIHAEIENSFYNKSDIELKKFGIGGKFECKKDYSDLDLEYGVYPEYLVYRESEDGILRLAGLIDLLIKSKNDIVLIDHKSSKKIELKSFYNPASRQSVKMLYPLNTLDDCNFSHYSLQLSTYAWMLQKINPFFNIKDLIINHYDHNGNNVIYHCPYLKDEVERMLLDYRKNVIKDESRANRKRIEY